MSSLIPPPLSSTPPPITGPLDEDDDDEFGDFRAAEDSYDCDDFSLPSSPQKSPEKEVKSDFAKVNLDINSNNSQKTAVEMPSKNFKEAVHKDFQDRRKSTEEESIEFQVNCSNSQPEAPSAIFDIHNTSEIIDDQIDQEIDERPVETDSAMNNDQISEITNETVDEFSDLQVGVSISVNTNCDEVEQKDDLNVEITDNREHDFTSVGNEEYLIEDSSESIQFEKTNTEEVSEVIDTNEIKSEGDGLDEISNTKEEDIDNCTKSHENTEPSLSLKVSESDLKLSDDEFGDFEDHFAAESEPEEDKDDEFANFASPLPPEICEEDDFGDFESSNLTQDDFEEFGDFSSCCDKSVKLEIDTKNALEKSEIILKGIFPTVGKELGDFDYFNDVKNNRVFEELKDVTETNALLYQWSKSHSQKMFLRALNIDMRNILYGPAWNSSMPRFAANLGLAPLQPVKSEILTPTPVQNVPSPSNSSQKSNGEIPTAQFDWSGSGLINPLDSNSTEPPDSPRSQAKTDLPERSEPIPSLFETDSLPQPTGQPSETVAFDLAKPPDDFSPFPSPKRMIPLRETHISNEMLNDCGAKPGWLEPTILTPDLPRKEPTMTPEDDDDEFDDFQMVLPQDNKAQTTEKTVSLPDLSEFDMTSKVAPSVDTTPLQEHIFATLTPQCPKGSGDVKREVEDDEFTDFHSSLPQNQILKPVPMEPLKPSVRYAPPVSTQINWPEPGVTDEDIRNIELVYSRKSEAVGEVTKKSGVSKGNSLDDEEWSDFVSVTNPVKAVLPERTATPDLPLSVLNLNHVQPPKQPIPVITATGLVQTRLSSNQQAKSSNVVQTTLQPNLFRPPQTPLQPSTISSQFAANQFQSGQDDDDWSDFVSSQPISNGFQKPKPPPTSWATANIIANPSHFEALCASQRKAAKTAIPSISAMPDLDFIAPKNRTKK